MEVLINQLYKSGKSIDYISEVVYDLTKRTIKGFSKKSARTKVEKHILKAFQNKKP